MALNSRVFQFLSTHSHRGWKQEKRTKIRHHNCFLTSPPPPTSFKGQKQNILPIRILLQTCEWLNCRIIILPFFEKIEPSHTHTIGKGGGGLVATARLPFYFFFMSEERRRKKKDTHFTIWFMNVCDNRRQVHLFITSRRRRRESLNYLFYFKSWRGK